VISATDVATVHDLALASEASIESLLFALLSQATDSLDGCRQAIPVVHQALASAGLSVDVHFAPAPGTGGFPILIGWSGPRCISPDIILCAHLDTSPPGLGWSRNPLGEDHEEFVFGRGAVVSKSDIAVFIHAAKAARQGLKDLPHVSIAVAITCDEGSGGCYGAAYLLGALGLRPRMAVFAGVSDVVTVAHNGCVQLKVKLTGTACHQSLLPSREDAMRHTTAICESLYAQADELMARPSAIPGLAHPTLNITKVVGGSAYGMSPRDVEIWIDRRVVPDEQLDSARDEIVSRIRALQVKTDVKTEIEVVRMAEPMRPVESAKTLVRILQNEAELAFGKTLKAQGSTLYTDARWFSTAGIPTVMFGAGEADIKISGANGSDERIPKRCLREGVVILARTLVRYCSQTGGGQA
jgi:acetylornithine deacetylase/succinyl-diaminopimelate desuccinylase-like protein